jgi:hypothetical protein
MPKATVLIILLVDRPRVGRRSADGRQPDETDEDRPEERIEFHGSILAVPNSYHSGEI